LPSGALLNTTLLDTTLLDTTPTEPSENPHHGRKPNGLLVECSEGKLHVRLNPGTDQHPAALRLSCYVLQ